MSPRHLGRGAGVLAVLGLAALACYQDPTSPAQCPAFCPGGRLTTVESLLATSIERDSSFQGYVTPHRSGVLLATALPGITSRPIFETIGFAIRQRIDTGTDTTTGPIVVDSMKLTVTVLRRDTAAVHNLRLAFYRLPVGIDSFSTLAGLAPAFAGTPLRIVNVDSLAARADRRDSVAGDTVIKIDSFRNAVTFRLKFDSSQTGFDAADSGKLALGVVVSGDSPPSIALGSIENGIGSTASWFYRVDSAGKLIHPDSLKHPLADSIQAPVNFDTFVFDAPPVTLDSNLTIGGVPSTRALLRIALPRALRDSTKIIRATLLLVPTGAALTTPDSVFILARRLATDLGAKSPVVPDTLVAVSSVFQGVPVDTVRVEMTTFFRLWQLDTTAVTAVYLSLLGLDRDSTIQRGLEAGSFDALRFFSSRTPAFRPAIQLTFVRHLKFGAF